MRYLITDVIFIPKKLVLYAIKALKDKMGCFCEEGGLQNSSNDDKCDKWNENSIKIFTAI